MKMVVNVAHCIETALKRVCYKYINIKGTYELPRLDSTDLFLCPFPVGFVWSSF